MMTLNDSPMEKMLDDEPLEQRSRCQRDLPACGGGASSAPVKSVWLRPWA